MAQQKRNRTDEWYTPAEFVRNIGELLDLEFVLDPAATKHSAKAPVFFTKRQDGLRQDWHATVTQLGGGAVWLNPPYSKPKPWVRKAAETAAAGTPVVGLLRASCDTTWMHEHVMDAAALGLVRGRISFEDRTGRSPGPANFPSMVALWRPGRTGPPHLFAVDTQGKPVWPLPVSVTGLPVVAPRSVTCPMRAAA